MEQTRVDAEEFRKSGERITLNQDTHYVATWEDTEATVSSVAVPYQASASSKLTACALSVDVSFHLQNPSKCAPASPSHQTRVLNEDRVLIYV